LSLPVANSAKLKMVLQQPRRVSGEPGRDKRERPIKYIQVQDYPRSNVHACDPTHIAEE
jgi:hypothetical protein